MMSDPDSLKAVKMIEYLGGPTLDGHDIKIANDLDTERVLLQWIAAQVSNFEGNPDGDVEDDDRHVGVALREIALEREEVLILNNDISATTCDVDQDESSQNPGYIPPSRLKKYAEYVKKENNLAQREINLLKFRISKIKEASLPLTKSIKSLHHVVYDLDSKMRNSEERISELSFRVDTSVASTVDNAQELLATLGYSGPTAEETNDVSTAFVALNCENADLDFARATLLETKNVIFSLTSKLREGMEASSTLRKEELKKIDDLQGETMRLRKAFRSARNPSNAHDDSVKETMSICLALQRGTSFEISDNEVLRNTLAEAEEFNDSALLIQAGSLDVERILRHAWIQDQATALKMEEGILDEALDSLCAVLDPLENLHASMSKLSYYVQEAEAVLEALGEELEDIDLGHLDGGDGGEIEGGINRVAEDVEMEQSLKRVFLEHEDLRPDDAPPLLLLTQEDVLAELQALEMRLSGVELSERSSVEGLIERHTKRPLHPALPQIYINSPLNTSPAFAFPADIRDLEMRARRRTAQLSALASSLEDEARETFAKDSNAKRLDAFIAKWTGS